MSENVEHSHSTDDAADAPAALESDRRLTEPKLDELGYAPLAAELAQSLASVGGSDGLVVGVYGQWGVGKSTFLAFLESYLRQREGPNQPVGFVEFNPWWFSGEEDMVRTFLDQFRLALATRGDVFKELAVRVGEFAEFVSMAPVPHADLARIPSRALRKRYDRSLRNVHELKADIENRLRGLDGRIFVFVDDVDRLTHEEIRQLFKVMKAVADFPNVIYVVALDKRVAVGALSDKPVLSGHEYLEKIVQVAIELPLPSRLVLRQLLLRRLAPIIGDPKPELFDDVHWANVVADGVEPLLQTPRDVVRLANSLALTYPIVRDEVNVPDFVGFEAVRVFVPDAYEYIRQNSAAFTRLDTDEPLTEAFLADWLASVGVRGTSLRGLLSRLFPRVAAAYGAPSYGSDFLRGWRRERRICSPEIFPIFVSLAPPSGILSRREMERLLDLAKDERALSGELKELGRTQLAPGVTRAGAFLDQVIDYETDDQFAMVMRPLLRGVLLAGNDLTVTEDRQGGLAFGNDLAISRLAARIFPHLREAERAQILYDMVRSRQSLGSTVLQISRLAGEDLRDEAGMPMLSDEIADHLHSEAATYIEDAAERGDLIDEPNLVFVLFRWLDWGEDERAVRKWCAKQIEEPPTFVKLARGFTSITTRQGLGDRGVRREVRLDADSMARLVDARQAGNAALALRSDERLSQSEQELMELVVEGLWNAKRLDVEPPSNDEAES